MAKKKVKNSAAIIRAFDGIDRSLMVSVLKEHDGGKCTRNTVDQMAAGWLQISPRRARIIEKHFGIKKEILNPDAFGKL